jgi:hypothetical protein
VVLFQGAMGEHTRSSDFEANGPNLTKDYQLDHNARFFIVVRGYRGQGSGSYSLSLSCLGGPCAGEVPPPPVVELSKTEQHNCVEAARVCAVAAVPEYSGAVGAVRAQQIFDRCLSEQTVETYHSDVPASCAPACQSEDGSFVCDAVVALLPWLADQTSACVDEFNGCVENCYDAGYDGARESLEEGGEAVCVTGEIAFNGSCRDVAELEVCGGRWAEDSCEACYLGCHSTAGAWMDDLDTICDEECNCEVSDDF